jgi:hypothetical protein
MGEVHDSLAVIVLLILSSLTGYIIYLGGAYGY